MKKVIYSLIFLKHIAVLGQTDGDFSTLPKNNKVFCDCALATKITIADSLIVGPTSSPNCAGLEEINTKDKTYSFEKEHHTAWYYIKIDKCGIWSFTITPVQKTDDYDFMLFKADSLNACSLIKTDMLSAIRSNNARNDSTKLGETGLNERSDKSFSKKGLNVVYSKALEVKEGETYILVLDNVYNNGKGFVIKFKTSKSKVFTIFAFDYHTKKPIEIESFFNKSNGLAMRWESTKTYARFKYSLENKYRLEGLNDYGYDYYTKFDHIRIVKSGYLSEFVHKNEMTCENNNTHLFMKKIYKDSSYLFKKIAFYKNLTLDTSISKISLYGYKEFLQKNPKVKIEITSINSQFVITEEDFKKAATSLLRYFTSQIGISAYQIKISSTPSQIKPPNDQVAFKVL